MKNAWTSFKHNLIWRAIRAVFRYSVTGWGWQLGKVLEYAEYRNFLPVIEKAQTACTNSGQPVENHFVELHEMVQIGSGAEREIQEATSDGRAAFDRAMIAHENVGKVQK